MPSSLSRAAVALLVFIPCACGSSVAAPVPVHMVKGSARAYLIVRDAQSRIIAHGDWWQVPRDNRLEVHLRFDFTDGSLSHETFVFSQRGVWSLLSYRSEQRGPSFPRDIEGRVDRDSGRYTVRHRDRDGGKADVDAVSPRRRPARDQLRR